MMADPVCANVTASAARSVLKCYACIMVIANVASTVKGGPKSAPGADAGCVRLAAVAIQEASTAYATSRIVPGYLLRSSQVLHRLERRLSQAGDGA